MSMDTHYEVLFQERNMRARCLELAAPFSHNITDQIRNAQYIYDFICEGCDLIDMADLNKFGIDIEDNTEVGINEETETSVNTAHAEIAAEAAARAASETIKSLLETEESKLAALYEEINKTNKAPDRRVFHIDVGDLSNEKSKSVIDDLMANREVEEAVEYIQYLGRKLLDGFRIPPSNR